MLILPLLLIHGTLGQVFRGNSAKTKLNTCGFGMDSVVIERGDTAQSTLTAPTSIGALETPVAPPGEPLSPSIYQTLDRRN